LASTELVSGLAHSAGLRVAELFAGYGSKIVLEEFSLTLAPGSIAALLGINGAGKTTVFRTIAGLLPPLRGEIFLDGRNITHVRAADKARSGLVLVPEGARSFHDLTVQQNLEIGGFILRDSATLRSRMAEVLSFFPRLRERSGQKAGLLSGGERQMLAIGRAIMLRPRILLLDEPFLGLAPIMISEVSDRLRQLSRATECGLLIAEQHVAATLRLSDRVFGLKRRRLFEFAGTRGKKFDESEIAAAIF
jgi:branched-chain amino acid transport system ATP-binding protein